MDISSKTKLLEEENFEKRDKSYLKQRQRVVLNVGGFKHEVLWSTLNRIPNSRLGKLKININNEDLYNLCDDFDPEKLEFFFDRDPTLFNTMLNYYREGKLHITDNVCPYLLQLELDYWGLDEPNMDLYCEEKLHHKQQAIDDLVENYNKILIEEKIKLEEINKIKSSKFKSFKNDIWDLLDNPFANKSSVIAKVFKYYCY